MFIYHRITENDFSEAPILSEMKSLNDSGDFDEIFIVNAKRRRSRQTELRMKSEKLSLWFRPFIMTYDLIMGHCQIILRPLGIFGEFGRRYGYYKNLLKLCRPDIIILPEDIVGSVSPLLIRAGHAYGIPSLVVPYTIANQQEAFRSLSTYPTLRASRWYNWLVPKMFHDWVLEQDGVAVIRLPAAYILSHFVYRISPPDPWMMNSGFANAIAVENMAMYDYYAASRIPPSKMKIVGAVYDDYLAKFLLDKPAELEKIRGELGIELTKPILLIAGCPDQSMSCPDFEFSDIEEFALKLSEAVRGLQDIYEIVVRPHPNFPELGVLLLAQGLRVTNVDTARLVPLSDIFIAFGSATIRWAVACAIPTINYDVFRYDYSDFKDLSCVISVADYEKFLAAVRAMRPGSPGLELLRANARVEAERWGMLDGKSVDRIISLIDELCATKPVPRTTH